jgi:hypothetical protein
MFTYANSGLVWWPVSVSVANTDTGAVEDAKFLALFKIRTRAERRAADRSLQKSILSKTANVTSADDIKKLTAELEKKQDTLEADLLERVRDFKQLLDTAGNEIAFTKETLQAMLATESLFNGFNRALNEASTGARAKN